MEKLGFTFISSLGTPMGVYPTLEECKSMTTPIPEGVYYVLAKSPYTNTISFHFVCEKKPTSQPHDNLYFT